MIASRSVPVPSTELEPVTVSVRKTGKEESGDYRSLNNSTEPRNLGIVHFSIHCSSYGDFQYDYAVNNNSPLHI